MHGRLETKSCLFLWSVTDVRLQSSDLEIVVLRIFAIMAPMLSVEWRRGRWYTFKVRALNVGRSTLGVNVQSRFRFRCDTEGQRHTLQEQIAFREIWIPISHAKHCIIPSLANFLMPHGPEGCPNKQALFFIYFWRWFTLNTFAKAWRTRTPICEYKLSYMNMSVLSFYVQPVKNRKISENS